MPPCWAGGGGRDRLPSFRRDAEAAQHGAQRQGEAAQFGLRIDQRGGSCDKIEFPIGFAPLRCGREFGHIPGIHDVGREVEARIAIGAIGPEAIEVDGERIARLRAFNIERAGLRVAARRDLRIGRILAARVHGRGHDGIAIGNAQDGFIGSQCGIVAFRGEVMRCHAVLLSCNNLPQCFVFSRCLSTSHERHL